MRQRVQNRRGSAAKVSEGCVVIDFRRAVEAIATKNDRDPVPRPGRVLGNMEAGDDWRARARAYLDSLGMSST
jgi:hypothetical protein